MLIEFASAKPAGARNISPWFAESVTIQKHTDAKEKPELDVEELFLKLGTFLNETKADTSSSKEGIDVEKL